MIYETTVIMITQAIVQKLTDFTVIIVSRKYISDDNSKGANDTIPIPSLVEHHDCHLLAGGATAWY